MAGVASGLPSGVPPIGDASGVPEIGLATGDSATLGCNGIGCPSGLLRTMRTRSGSTRVTASPNDVQSMLATWGLRGSSILVKSPFALRIQADATHPPIPSDVTTARAVDWPSDDGTAETIADVGPKRLAP